MPHLFHIVAGATWAAAGDAYRPDTFAAEGFVHCSYASQVAGTAQQHYGGIRGLSLLEIDPDRLPAPVRVEGGFPHVYGEVPRAAVIAVHDLDQWLLTRDLR